MNGLFKFIPPFAPDQSGATAVLFSLGGIVVICDAGGCAGNICGFDEPRWFTEKSAVFSAALRDIDAILGRDERLVQKLEEATSFIDAKFAAIIGTPVPAVIGTDFRALRRMAEQRIGLPVVAVDSTGIGLYDEGEAKTYMALLSAFAGEKGSRRFDVGVFGATPLNLPYKGYEKELKSLLEQKYGTVSLFTGENGIEDLKNAGSAKLNIAVSTSGIKACEYLKQRFGTEFVVEFPLWKDGGSGSRGKTAISYWLLAISERQTRAVDNLHAHGNRREPNVSPSKFCSRTERSGSYNDRQPTLIIHQQILANSVRDALEAEGETADVATWFTLNRNYARAADIQIREEDEFFALLSERKYSRIIADPIFKRCLAEFDGEFIPISHYACSGELFAGQATENWQQLISLLRGKQIETA